MVAGTTTRRAAAEFCAGKKARKTDELLRALTRRNGSWWEQERLSWKGCCCAGRDRTRA